MGNDKCEFCGKDTAFAGATTCTNCWEVSARLARFLKSEKGRRFTHKLLAKAEKEATSE